MDINQIKALLFDMDGVLIDSMRYHTKSFLQAFRKYDVKIKEEKIYNLEGKEDIYIIKDILEQKNLENLDSKKIAKERREIFNQIERTKVFDGMPELLKKITKEYELSVVSGSTRRNLNNFVNKFYPNIFDCLVSGDDLSNQKPHPEPFEKCVKGVNIEKDEAIAIENAPLGVESVKNAELACIAVATYVQPQSLKEADIVFENHKELKAYLKNNFL
ncbi:HAD family phosphatase [archaeon SCG-AAA382B04]|nr:HAD family phosphatase [archaeon SCG-AAA382B04]